MWEIGLQWEIRENIKLTMKLFDALISPILFYASEVWWIDCSGKLEKDPAESVQNKFLKWLLGVNKYGRFPMTIDAQCRNFKFWLMLTKNEYKLSQIKRFSIECRKTNTGVITLANHKGHR